jgi:hypothetical protein
VANSTPIAMSMTASALTFVVSITATTAITVAMVIQAPILKPHKIMSLGDTILAYIINLSQYVHEQFAFIVRLNHTKTPPWMVKREISEKYWLELDDALDGF